MGTLVFWVTLALIFFWTIGAYNRLVKLRAQAMQKSLAVGTHLTQYIEWIRLQLPDGNPASVFAGQGSHDGDDAPWRTMSDALTPADHCIQYFRTKPLDEEAQAQLVDAFVKVDNLWDQLLAEEPDLAGAVVPDLTQHQWQAHQIHRRTAVADYNQAVRDYHRAFSEAPEKWLAKACHMATLPEISFAD
jgi:LemA protein